MENTIFVQIASYRDPELINTLNSLINNADVAGNLKICICWQHGDDETTEIFLDDGFDILGFTEDDERVHKFPVIHMEKNKAKIDAIQVHHFKSEGACWARNCIQQLYDGEKYTLQLDSHHRFVDSWDTLVIEMLEGLRSESVPKPLLTAYLPSYDPENDPAGRIQTPWRMNFDRIIPEGAIFFLPSSMDNWKEMTGPEPARFYSGHFCFVDGDFCVAVQHFDKYFFHGEEINIAARAFTHGYDMYHPSKILAWHEYTRKNREKIWSDGEHTTAAKKKGLIKKDWVERNNECHKLNRIFFGMDGEDPNQFDFGKYGFGTVRTLRQYEEYAGISFKYRGVQQATLDRLPPPNNMPYTTEEEWKATFVGSHDLRILVHKTNELGENPGDYDFWYIGAHDKDGKEIFRKDMTQPEINNRMKDGNEWIDSRLIFLSNHIPATWTVWTHSKSKGWLKKIDKNVD